MNTLSANVLWPAAALGDALLAVARLTSARHPARVDPPLRAGRVRPGLPPSPFALGPPRSRPASAGGRSLAFRRLQTGLVQNYAMVMLLGVFVFVTTYLLVR